MKRIFLPIFLIVFCCNIKAQKYELGAAMGLANYNGDLQDARFQLENTRFGGGMFLRYNATKYFNLQTGIDAGTITGNDALSSDSEKIVRNLSFKTPIADFYLIGEYNLFGFDYLRRSLKNQIRPYFFAGIGIYHFNPKAFYQNRWVPLQPLSTEGEGFNEYPGRKPYRLTQYSIPFGMGIKYKLSNSLIFGVELRMHKLFTDYIDDVSTTFADPEILRAKKGNTAVNLSDRSPEIRGRAYPPNTDRGNPKYKDWYYFSFINISYILRPKRACFEF